MLSSGNGNPMQCVSNLVRIVRGECVYDRVKGVDPTLIDKPSNIANPLLREDIRWLIRTYEPRVNLDSVDLHSLAAQVGAHKLSIEATVEG